MPGQIKIFISYAHADFANWPGYNSSRARLILEQAIQYLGGNDGRLHYKVVMDTRNLLRPGDNIDEKTATAIDDCDIGLALLSESYCNSPECEREFRLLTARRSKPLFLVELEDVWSENVIEHPLSHLRDNIDRVLSVQFWGVVNERATPFGFPLPNEDPVTKVQYNDALRNLVNGIKLRGIQILRQRRELVTFSEPPESPFIFVAAPTPDVRADAERLLRRLRADGRRVYMPNEDADLNQADFASISGHLEKVIARSDYYVQFFGATPGREIATTGKRLAELQFDIAEKAGKPMLLWQSPGFDPSKSDPAYLTFLRRAAPHILGYEELEAFAAKEIDKRLREIAAADQRAAKLATLSDSLPQGATAEVKTVVIDAAPEDDNLRQMLADAMPPNIGVNSVDPEPDNDSLREAALQNNAVIMVWGGSQAGWKRTRAHLNLFRRYAGPDGTPPRKAIGDAAPPPPQAPACPTGPDVSVMRVKEGVDPKALSTLLAALGIATGPRAPA
jgi:hypothetical protein